MNGPMNSPRITWGIMITIPAVESIVAEPVSFVKYHASAKLTMVVPKIENAWLTHKTKNFFSAVVSLKNIVWTGHE